MVSIGTADRLARRISPWLIWSSCRADSQVFMPESTHVFGVQGGKSPPGTPNQAWLSLDLLLLLSQLYDNGHAPAVHQILEIPKGQCPELLVLSSASALRYRLHQAAACLVPCHPSCLQTAPAASYHGTRCARSHQLHQ